MTLEAYPRSGHQVQNQVPQRLVQSQNSLVLYQDSYLPQSGDYPIMRPTHPGGQMPYQNAQFVARDIDIRVYGNPSNSGMSIEESSLITDANSSLSGDTYFSSYYNIDSPASNCAISSASTLYQLPGQHQNSQEQPSDPVWSRRQGETLPNQVAMPQLMMPNYQASVSSMMTLKKPRLEMNQEVLNSAQLPPRSQYPMNLRSYNPEPTASLYTQQNLSPNQRIAASLVGPQRAQMQSLSPQQQQELIVSQNAALKDGIYVRRLMCYVEHQRRRPSDNHIDYWRKFVEEYYYPGAKTRWCLSKFSNVGRHAHSVFSQAAMDSWSCDFCRSETGKGFVATYEILPKLKKIYFDSGVTDELLYIDSPSEYRLPSGCVVLCLGKAVLHSVYENFRTVHEGHLRVIFSKNLKIMSWEFCLQNHEEIIPRRLVAAQVKEIVENAARCQNNMEGRGTDGVSGQDLAANCNRLAVAGHELLKKLELPLINDLGFSKNVVRYLQVNEVFGCMKDLITYSQRTQLSPIESLKRYPADVVNAKLKMKQTEEPLQILHGTGPSNWQRPISPIPQVSNLTPQSWNPSEQANSSGIYCQKLPMEQPTMSSLTSSIQLHLNQSPYLTGSSHILPNVAQIPSPNQLFYLESSSMVPNVAQIQSSNQLLHPLSSHSLPNVAQIQSPNQLLHPLSSHSLQNVAQIQSPNQLVHPGSMPLVPKVAHIPSTNQLVHPGSSQQEQGDPILNDLLSMMRYEGTTMAHFMSRKDKARLVYDPNTQLVPTGMQPRDSVGGTEEEREKGKGLNSSSSSNSNKLSPDVMLVKREPDLEEDFTSPSHFQ